MPAKAFLQTINGLPDPPLSLASQLLQKIACAIWWVCFSLVGAGLPAKTFFQAINKSTDPPHSLASQLLHGIACAIGWVCISVVGAGLPAKAFLQTINRSPDPPLSLASQLLQGADQPLPTRKISPTNQSSAGSCPRCARYTTSSSNASRANGKSCSCRGSKLAKLRASWVGNTTQRSEAATRCAACK